MGTRMQNYRNFASAGSAQTSARRGPGPMVAPPHAQTQPPPQMTAQQIAAQRVEEQRRIELGQRISTKPTDRSLPEELSVTVGDGVDRYRQLRELEARMDSVMMRKRLDISDNLQRRYTRREGVMRIWVSNTAEGQPWQLMEEDQEGANENGDDAQTFEFGENSPATFRVKIQGRLLDESADVDEPIKEDGEKNTGTGKEKEAEGKTGEPTTKRPAQRPRFSHFFKAITVDFSPNRNPALQPDGYSAIEWRKAQPGPQNPNYDPNSSNVSFDALEFERMADESINITINLVRDEKNERFKLSPQLAEILDTEEEDRAGAVQGVWEYCRAMNLQKDEDKRSVVCDDALTNLFRQDHIYFPYVPDLLLPHLHPLPPIRLHYTIRVDNEYIKGDPDNGIPPKRPTIYDIRVPLPNPLSSQLTRFHTSKAHIQTLQTIVRTDDDLALLVQKIHQTNAKRKFYDNLAKDPTNFVKRWISSQQRDLEVILAEANRDGGEDGLGEQWRRGGEEGVWGTRMAKESVGLMLAKGHGKS